MHFGKENPILVKIQFGKIYLQHVTYIPMIQISKHICLLGMKIAKDGLTITCKQNKVCACLKNVPMDKIVWILMMMKSNDLTKNH
jgi:hypothetical protein